MRRVDISKCIFFVTLVGTVTVAALLVGLHAGYKESAVFRLVSNLYDQVMLVWSEKEDFITQRPWKHLQRARYSGDGVTINNLESEGPDLILLAGFFDNQNELRLIRRNGAIVARWPVSVNEIFGDATHLRHPPTTDWNAGIHGALALPDGSIVFNFDYIGLVKLDRCGRLIWKLDRQTHHSVERAEGGGFWTQGRNYYPRDTDSPFPPFKTPFYDDTLLKVSDDGEVEAEISMARVFFDNDLLSLLTLTGVPYIRGMPTYQDADGDTREIFHQNDVEVLRSSMAAAFPAFAAGDLLVSLRNRNMLLVLDPESRQVKWWHIGPWIRQHDPDFQPNGVITVFSNNTDNTLTGEYWGGSTIIQINPSTNRYKILYGGTEQQFMYSRLAGKHQVHSGGRILITEHGGGRFFEVGPEGTVTWEYVNRYDDDEVAEVTSATSYNSKYFEVDTWSCSH